MGTLNASYNQLKYVMKVVIEDRFSKVSFPNAEEDSVELIEREIGYLEKQISTEEKNIKSTILTRYSDIDPYSVDDINDRIRINRVKIDIYEYMVLQRQGKLLKLKKGLDGTTEAV